MAPVLWPEPIGLPSAVTMSATIQLNNPQGHFTNLDFITGKVIVNLPTETSIAGIQIKLEGESKTRLSGPRHPHHEQSDKRRAELEVHKVRLIAVPLMVDGCANAPVGVQRLICVRLVQILYKVATLFPNPAVFNQANPNTAYTFAAGTYEYPFEFKVGGPFLRICPWSIDVRTLTVASGSI